MIKNTARIDTIYPHLTLQNKQSVSSLSFTLANLQFACQLTGDYTPGPLPDRLDRSRTAAR